MKVLKLFWACFVSTGGVIATFIALDQIKLTWAFWVLVPVSVAATALFWYASNGVDMVRRIKDYPKLLIRVQAAEAAVDEGKIREANFADAIVTAMDRGMQEGREQVRGGLLSAQSKIPNIVATVEFEMQVSFLCESTDEPPLEGARFLVVAANSGTIRGVVQTCYAGGATYLKCVEPSNPAFWEHLADKIDHDDTLPQGIKLVEYSYVLPDSEARTPNNLVESIPEAS